MKKMQKEVGLYIATAMIGNIIDFSVFLGLQAFGLSIILAQWLAAFIGNSHNFLWQYFVIFDHNQKASRSYLFSIILAFILIFLSGPLIVFLEMQVQNTLLSKIIVMMMIGTIGYSARKYLIFRMT